MTGVKIEVLADTIESAKNAQLGGADRVELCANLPEGGTTPSAGLIRSVRNEISIGLQVMIRPRGGDFLYSDEEIESMLYDTRTAKDLVADGVVFGCLTREGNVDIPNTRKLIEAARPMNVTFHRALDMTRDPLKALEDLIELGIDRVLTSGLKQTASEGLETLKALNDQAANRIIILAGGGIRPHNISEIVTFTGVRECHVSAFSEVESTMIYRNDQIKMGKTDRSEFIQNMVDPEIVRSFRNLQTR